MDTMSLFAEVSVAFAGFAGLIAAIRRPEDQTLPDAVTLALIVSLSMGGLFIALLALSMTALGMDLSLVFAIASALTAGWTLVGTVLSSYALRSSFRRSMLLFVGFWLLMAGLVIVNVLNAAGVYFEREPAPVVFAGITSLAVAAGYFAYLLVYPIWASAIANRDARHARQVEATTNPGTGD